MKKVIKLIVDNEVKILTGVAAVVLASNANAFDTFNSAAGNAANILQGVGAAGATLSLCWEATKGIFIPSAEVQVQRAMKIVACSAVLFGAGSLIDSVVKPPAKGASLSLPIEMMQGK